MDARGIAAAPDERTAEALENEESLVSRARVGDAGAWANLYNAHYRPIFRYFLSRVGDPSVCEDLAATVFLGAVKSIGSYTYTGTPFLAWLYRIARNVAADHFRRNLGRQRGGVVGHLRTRLLSRFTAEDAGGAAEPVASAESDDPGANVESIDLRRALSTLGEREREVIALHYYMGLTLREAARFMGMQERAVYSLQARALVGLRTALAA